jgi:hypothetical protein
MTFRAGLAVLALAASTATGVLVASPAQAAPAYYDFTVPSGNISCLMTPSYARCDIFTHTYKPTKKPASCHSGWGQSLFVTKSGKGHFLCIGDSIDGSTRILKYGKSKTFGRFKCTSRKAGMTCTNLKNGHGFKMSQSSYKVF